MKELRKFKIIHWDIKLENIFVHNENLKLGDFGFSKINIDKAYSKLGSKQTMAPEIILNLQQSTSYDYKCDMWSIGCVFYRLLFGKKFLFDDLVENDVNKIIDWISKYNNEIPITRVISK